jgi:CRISPR/Cas system-associated protein endoribonuclease Cas2
MKQERLNKEHKVENGSVVIIETYKKVMNRQELLAERLAYQGKIINVDQQTKTLKDQKNSFIQAITEIDEMLGTLPAEEDQE